MNLETILQSVPTLQVAGPLNREITSICYDSRRAQPGSLFVALYTKRHLIFISYFKSTSNLQYLFTNFLYGFYYFPFTFKKNLFRINWIKSISISLHNKFFFRSQFHPHTSTK